VASGDAGAAALRDCRVFWRVASSDMAAVEVEILVGGGMEVSIALEVEVVGRRFVVSRRSDGRYGNDCGEYDVLSFPEAGKSSGRPAVEHTGNFEATLLVKEENGGESRVSEFEAP
jgi:hypothetical protein